MAILGVYKRLKADLLGHHIVYKLAVVKIVVALQFLQRSIFSGLNGHNVIKPSTYISTMDWTYGIPNFITVCEMFIFSFLFLHPYSWKPFTNKNKQSGQPLERWSFVKALINVWNVSDILGGILDIFKYISGQRNGGTYQPKPETQQEMDYYQDTSYRGTTQTQTR
jgi:hypothetical protein